MEIKYNELDDVIRGKLRDRLIQAVVRVHKTLPLPGQESMILEAVTDDLREELEGMIVLYYASYVERTVVCSLSNDDLINIFKNIAV